MSYAVSRILTALVLLISTESYQFAKVPGLIHHYSQHLIATPDLTLLSFLAEHYGQSDVRKTTQNVTQTASETVPLASDDTSGDDELPFKHDDCEFSTDLSLGLPVLTEVRFTLTSTRVPFQPLIHTLLPQTLGTDIFEPPRQS